MMDPMQPGAVVDGRYRLERKLGEGTFGSVWLAQDQRLAGRVVGIKFLKPEFLDHAEAVTRFENEANALARVQHSNVVAVIDRGDWNRFRYFVLEYVEGRDLDAWLQPYRASGVLPDLGLVARIMDQVCAGLSAAHSVKVPGPIVHRDLKPANVMLRETPGEAPEAKVLDFGIAQLGSRMRTRTGGLMGTPVYMAPEQGLGRASQVGPATDVFSLAVMLVELLTLRPWLSEEEVWWTVAMQRGGELRAILGGLRADVGGALWDVAAKAMQPSPADRFEDAGRMREALRSAWQQQGTAFVGSDPGRISGSGERRPTPSNATMVGGPVGQVLPPDRTQLAKTTEMPQLVKTTEMPQFAMPPGTHGTVLTGTQIGTVSLGPSRVTAPTPAPERGIERWVVGGLAVLTALACGAWVVRRNVHPTVAVAAPRPLSPQSSVMTVASRPMFRWSLPEGVEGARVELCRDRACERVERRIDAVGSEVQAPEALTPGLWFWRLRGAHGESVGSPGPTWPLVVRRNASDVEGGSRSFRLMWDSSGDGRADVPLCNRSGQTVIARGSAEGLDVAGSVPLQGTGSSCAAGHIGSLNSIGDCNGDGWEDFALMSSSPRSILVWNGGPSGLSTSPVQRLEMPAGSSTGLAVKGVGDVTGDGYADSIFVDAIARVWLYRGSVTGLGSEGRQVIRESSMGRSVLRVGPVVRFYRDLNGDGVGDLGVMRGDGALELFAGTGEESGLLSAPSWRVGLSSPPAAGVAFASFVGDVNGDGYDDAATVFGPDGEVDQRLTVYRGSAMGIRREETESRSLRGPVTELAPMMDTNGDGFEDLFARTGDGTRRLLGGPGGLGTDEPYPAAVDPSVTLTLGPWFDTDLDGDGLGDILFEGTRAGAPVIVVQRGAVGAATAPIVYPVP